MATQDKNNSNGVTKDSKDVANNQNATSQKPALSNLVVTAPTPPTPTEQTVTQPVYKTIEEKMAKFQELASLSKRRSELVEALAKVNEFKIDPTGASERLTFSGTKNDTFSIMHPVVIEELIKVLKAKYTALIAEVDAQFNF